MTVTPGAAAVTTADAQPLVAPHKISAKATKDVAQWQVPIQQDGDLYPGELVPEDANSGLKFGDAHVVGVMHRLDSTAVDNGTLIDTPGFVCSDQVACSAVLACNGGVDQVNGNVTGSIAKSAAVLAGHGDGTATVSTYLQVEGRGWV